MADAMNTSVIEKMTREEFHQKMIKVIGRRSDFAKLVTFGADTLADDEKKSVRLALAENGIPLETTDSDLKLTEIAREISARAVKLE